MKFKSALCLIALLFAAFILALQSNIAFAQSNSCNKLTQTLRSLDKNRDYRSYKRNNATFQAAQKELKEQESKFVRGGCQKALNAKQKLSGACRILARKILRGRSDVEKLKNKLATGQMVAEQRKQILAQIAARNCNNPRSSANVNSRQNNQAPKSLFDILFGNRNVEIRADDDFGIETNLSTIRTVCARTCDGYYWPISFSTTLDNLPQDEAQCQIEGKGMDVELFYHKNPGEQAEDMVSITGLPYKSTPNAFRYRQEYDQTCSIKRDTGFGLVQLVSTNNNKQTRMIVKINELTFPMPLRDPRYIQAVTIAHTINVPLPIRRPLRKGEEPPKIQISTAPEKSEPLRTFILGGKTIRIVGPDTPYARLGEAGT